MTQDNRILNIRREIERINADFYNSHDSSRSLAHWALKCLLADVDPRDDALVTATAIGAPGDTGLDAYWVDEDNGRLIFVQAKDTENVTNPQRLQVTAAQAFRSAITGLTHQEFVRSRANSILLEAYNSEIADLLYDETYSIYAVLAAGGRVRPNSSARSYCEGPGSDYWVIQDESDSYNKDFKMEVLDLLELQDEANRLRFGGSPDCTLSVVRVSPGEVAFHHMGGPRKSALATVYAESLADAYSTHRSRIFQYNPRGPQGSNKVNSEISTTLSDPTLKEMFHILNNGITIVCDSFLLRSESELYVRNLQIVNGCQTVYTLYRCAPELDDSVRVNIRVVEGLQPAPQIAKASNSQTSVKAEQLSSLDAVHNAIQSTLENNSPPWYYEKQMGSVRFLSEAARRTHRERFGSRSVSISELGKDATAFLGYPITAKHDQKAVFERRGSLSAVHDTIFSSSNQANQLLLPVLVERRVRQSIKDRITHLEQEQSGVSVPLQPDPAAEIGWLAYARYHIVGLIGSSILQGIQSNTFPPETSCKNYIETMGTWIEQAFRDASDAIHFYVRVDARKPNHVFNIRQFFRDETIYQDMVTEMRRLASRNAP